MKKQEAKQETFKAKIGQKNRVTVPPITMELAKLKVGDPVEIIIKKVE